MSDSRITRSTVKNRLFPESKWTEISNRVAAAFRMSDEERARFQAKDVARLIGSLPFLAGCDDAERTSVAHLGTYILSIRETKPYFNATQGDNESVFDRLRLISSFKGGDASIIERGMSLLALNMVHDYRRDAAEDVFLRKYNPVSDGSFDHDALTTELKQRIERTSCPEMDEIMDPEVGPLGYWGW
ncbi:hypothetical protein [Salinispira pacifica]